MIQTIISIITSAISAIALIVTVIQNQRLRAQYFDSKQPQLCMNLKKLDQIYYLSVKNIGGSVAKNVILSPIKIENNGDDKNMLPDKLFNNSFDLYPGEEVSGVVAIDATNIQFEAFPYLYLSVKYEGLSRVHQEYERVVVFDAGSDLHVRTDVTLDRNTVSDINKSMRALVRIANYLDGNQVAPFDELNILAGKTLHDDMEDVIKAQEAESNVVCRDEVINQNVKNNR